MAGIDYFLGKYIKRNIGDYFKGGNGISWNWWYKSNFL
jgi:hypothetical protein